MDREYPKQPLVGVGALIKKGDSILLVKRENEPGKGLWSIPGGLLELGETLEDAVKREVKEETGLEVEIEHLIDVIDYVNIDEQGRVRFHFVLVDYLAHPRGGMLTSGGEVSEVRWVDRNYLNQYQTTKTLKKLLKKINFYEEKPAHPSK